MPNKSSNLPYYLGTPQQDPLPTLVNPEQRKSLGYILANNKFCKKFNEVEIVYIKLIKTVNKPSNWELYTEQGWAAGFNESRLRYLLMRRPYSTSGACL